MTTNNRLCFCAEFARAHSNGSNAARVSDSSPARANFSRHKLAAPIASPGYATRRVTLGYYHAITC